MWHVSEESLRTYQTKYFVKTIKKKVVVYKENPVAFEARKETSASLFN